MPELGNRSSVMGPQPIAKPFVVPPAMLAAVGPILELLARGHRAELEALAVSRATGELRELMDAIAPGAYASHEIIAHAKVNKHYYLKARLFGTRAAPFTLQLRLGEHDGRWVIWEAVNLSSGRTAWTR
ncbi:MAG: hypothetical protein ACREPW_04365 [Candidatus Binataceae bacterium]